MGKMQLFFLKHNYLLHLHRPIGYGRIHLLDVSLSRC